MARRTKEEAQETRQGILDAAVCAFYRKGVAQATLEDIAESAGVTRGAVYWHFKNKQEIVAALHDELHRPLFAMAVEDVETDSPEPLKQLEALYVRLLDQLVMDEARHRILAVFITKCDYTGDMECFLEYQSCQKQQAINIFTTYFERAMARGQLPKDADARILALSGMCFLSGICNEYLRHPGVLDVRKDGAALVAQFFKGFRP